MRSALSANMVASLMASATGEDYHTLIELSGTGIDTKRYVDNYEDIDFGGNTYTAAAFRLNLPDDVEDKLPDVNCVVDNVDLALISDIRTVSGVPAIKMFLVMRSDSPPGIEVGPFNFQVRAVDYDALRITGSLKYEDMLNDTYPAELYTPVNFPGLFP